MSCSNDFGFVRSHDLSHDLCGTHTNRQVHNSVRFLQNSSIYESELNSMKRLMYTRSSQERGITKFLSNVYLQV